MANKRLIVIFTLATVFMFFAFYQANAAQKNSGKTDTESGITGVPYSSSGENGVPYMSPDLDGTRNFDWSIRNQTRPVSENPEAVMPPYRFSQYDVSKDPPIHQIPVEPGQVEAQPMANDGFYPFGPGGAFDPFPPLVDNARQVDGKFYPFGPGGPFDPFPPLVDNARQVDGKFYPFGPGGPFDPFPPLVDNARQMDGGEGEGIEGGEFYYGSGRADGPLPPYGPYGPFGGDLLSQVETRNRAYIDVSTIIGGDQWLVEHHRVSDIDIINHHRTLDRDRGGRGWGGDWD